MNYTVIGLLEHIYTKVGGQSIQGNFARCKPFQISYFRVGLIAFRAIARALRELIRASSPPNLICDYLAHRLFAEAHSYLCLTPDLPFLQPTSCRNGVQAVPAKQEFRTAPHHAVGNKWSPYLTTILCDMRPISSLGLCFPYVVSPQQVLPLVHKQCTKIRPDRILLLQHLYLKLCYGTLLNSRRQCHGTPPSSPSSYKEALSCGSSPSAPSFFLSSFLLHTSHHSLIRPSHSFGSS